MAIHIALNHKTHYRYDRAVMLGPQTIRLRPAPHCRTPILAYSLKVLPKNHFINWQQDPQANYLARLVFPERTTEFLIEVDLVAEMAIFNPRASWPANCARFWRLRCPGPGWPVFWPRCRGAIPARWIFWSA
jgi:transglutaminase-like putative cysteine protease